MGLLRQAPRGKLLALVAASAIENRGDGLQTGGVQPLGHFWTVELCELRTAGFDRSRRGLRLMQVLTLRVGCILQSEAAARIRLAGQ